MRRFFSYPFLTLIFFLILNFALWKQTHKVQLPWTNVPPVPEEKRADMLTLGDKQLAYRYYALMLQNLGSIGAHDVSLKKIDYAKLQKWLFLEEYLDPVSNVIPMMAAQYFGAVDDSDKLDYITAYLAQAGSQPHNNRWRWLAHGVFLARHVQKDNEKALALAYKLAENKDPTLAAWAKQMPVFILNDQGDKDTAYKIMLNILISNVDTMSPQEITYMRDYICHTLLVEKPKLEKPEFCSEISP